MLWWDEDQEDGMVRMWKGWDGMVEIGWWEEDQ